MLQVSRNTKIKNLQQKGKALCQGPFDNYYRSVSIVSMILKSELSSNEIILILYIFRFRKGVVPGIIKYTSTGSSI